MLQKKLSIIVCAVLFAAAAFAANPDLIVSEISIMPTNPYTTDSIVVKAVCRNIGTAMARASHMRFKIGGESSPPVYAIESLAPGATRQWLREVHLTVAQNYLITVTADANHEVIESNETNNVKTFAFTVLAPGKADLTVQSITTSPAAPRAGDHVNITIQYANIGTATAVKFITVSTVGGEAPPTMPATYHNVRPGHTFTENRTVTFSHAGIFVIKSRIDANNEVEESNERNNARQLTLTVRR
jgi:subtilase family serine protease